jgi:hypothetical protein
MSANEARLHLSIYKELLEIDEADPEVCTQYDRASNMRYHLDKAMEALDRNVRPHQDSIRMDFLSHHPELVQVIQSEASPEGFSYEWTADDGLTVWNTPRQAIDAGIKYLKERGKP